MKNVIIIGLFLVVTASFAQQKKWTLQACVNHALENNLTVKQSELDFKSSEFNKKDAIGNFFPSLNAASTYSWSVGLTQNPTTFDAVTATSNTLSGNINSNITIYNGLRNLNQLYRSRLEMLSSQYQLDKIKDDISLLVANAFLQILFNKEQLKVLKTQQEVSENQLKRTQNLVDTGALPKGDLLEIQATLATQDQQIVNAENAITLSRISLAQILLIKDYKNFDTSDDEYNIPLTTILNETPETIFNLAKEVRFEIKIAEANAEIAHYNLKIAKGVLQPTLSGFYGFGTNYFTSQLFETPNFDTQISNNKRHNFGFQLSIPIFNGLSARNNVGRNLINVERAEYQKEQANLDLESNIYQAFADTKGAEKAFEAAQKTLAARQEAYNYSKERFDVGLLNAFDFTQSQNQVEIAQSEVIRTKYDYIFKLKVLEFYFGIPISKLN